MSRRSRLILAMVLIMVCEAVCGTRSAAASTWQLQSIDNMHLTRDYPCYPESADFMTSIAASEKAMGANTAGVDTPYDDAANYSQCTPADPMAFEQSWVNALREQGLHVWFRQTWFNWEGSYGAPKMTADTNPSIPLGDAYDVLSGADTSSYMAKTYHFILDHPALYADGDIFTPEAEPQNGGILLSWGHYNSATQFHDWPTFNRWLRDSMTVDTIAFRKLGIRVSVGYWGLPCSDYQWNGTDNIEPATITQMGSYVTDCYFHDPTQVASSLQWMYDVYHAPVILGEWGDVWDNNAQPDTANEINMVMGTVRRQSFVTGFNYWQVYGGGGGESLVDPTTLQINASGMAVQGVFGQ